MPFDHRSSLDLLPTNPHKRTVMGLCRSKSVPSLYQNGSAAMPSGVTSGKNLSGIRGDASGNDQGSSCAGPGRAHGSERR